MTKIIVNIANTKLGTSVVCENLKDDFGDAVKPTVDGNTVLLNVTKNFEDTLEILEQSVFKDPKYTFSADQSTETITVERAPKGYP